MKLDPVLLNMAASWSEKAYNKKNKDAIKIENKITGYQAHTLSTKISNTFPIPLEKNFGFRKQNY